jgi:DnaK suppressor protein
LGQLIGRWLSRKSQRGLIMNGMNGLSVAELAALQQALKTRERSLGEEMHQEFAKRTGGGDDATVQYQDTADDDAIVDQLNDSAVRSMTDHAQSLIDVEASLKAIDQGEYGLCRDCQQQIGFKRLTAYPTATRCVPCQERHESGASRPSL